MYLDKISVSGTVGVGVSSLLRLVPDVGDVDRDAPLFLLFALVDLVEFDMFRQACKHSTCLKFSNILLIRTN